MGVAGCPQREQDACRIRVPAEIVSESAVSVAMWSRGSLLGHGEHRAASQFKAQFVDLSADFLVAHRHASQRVTRCPLQVLATSFLTDPKALGMPVEIQESFALATAAKANLLARSRVWQEQCRSRFAAQKRLG